MALVLQHQTRDQFLLRFWKKAKAAFDAGDKATYHYLIWWVWDKVQTGDVTVLQVRTAYNTALSKTLNATQFTNLVNTRFVPIKDRYLLMLEETEV